MYRWGTGRTNFKVTQFQKSVKIRKIFSHGKNVKVILREYDRQKSSTKYLSSKNREMLSLKYQKIPSK